MMARVAGIEEPTSADAEGRTGPREGPGRRPGDVPGRGPGAGRLATGAVGVATALASIEVLTVAGTVVHGLALPTHGAAAVAGGAWQRIGAAFLSDVGGGSAAVLVVAIALAAVPALLGAGRAQRVRLAVGLSVAAAAGVFVGGLLALRARLYQYHHLGRTMPPDVRWSTALYLLNTVGVAVVVVVAAIAIWSSAGPAE
jgi:hypothetical protein